MVCDKVEVVLIEVLISHGGKWLKELKLEVPNISQLFHFRKSRRIHVVASAGYLDEIQYCRNKMLSSAGEPLPISEAVAATLRVEDVVRALSGHLRDDEGEGVVEDPLRATWDDGPRVVGIRAATQGRRTDLINLAMHALGLTVVNFDGNHNPTRPIAGPITFMQPQVTFPFLVPTMQPPAQTTQPPVQPRPATLNVQAKSFVPPSAAAQTSAGGGNAHDLGVLLRTLGQATPNASASASELMTTSTEASTTASAPTTVVPISPFANAAPMGCGDNDAAVWAEAWYTKAERANDDGPAATPATTDAPVTRETSCGGMTSTVPSREATAMFFGNVGEAPHANQTSDEDTLMVTDPGELPAVLDNLFRSHLVDVVSEPSVVDGSPAGPTIVKLSIAGPPGGSEAQRRRLAKDTKAIVRLARNECCRVCGEVKPLSVAHASLSKTLVHMALRKPEKLCSLLCQCMELLPHESLEPALMSARGPDDVSSSFWVKLRGVKGDARRVALFRMLEECVRCAKNVELMLASRDVDALSALHNVAILTRQRLDDDDEDLIASATVAGTASNMEAFQAHLNVLVPTH